MNNGDHALIVLEWVLLCFLAFVVYKVATSSIDITMQIFAMFPVLVIFFILLVYNISNTLDWLFPRVDNKKDGENK